MSKVRLIDADALFAEFENAKWYDNKDRDLVAEDILLDVPAVDAVEVVRCGDCLYWQDRQVMLSDGSCRNYLPDEPDYVTASVGINMGAHCTKHGLEDESGSWFWANACDFCSRGERRKYA